MAKNTQTEIENRSRIEGKIARKEARIGRELLSNPVFKMPRTARVAQTAMDAMVRPCMQDSVKPVAFDGSESFDLKVSYVRKSSAFSKAAGTTALGAAATQAYIEREGAAEVRETAVERDARAAARAEMMLAMGDHKASTAAKTQSYIEREGAAEPLGRILSSFGTFPGETSVERMTYWDALDAYENPPPNHHVLINPHADPAFWAIVDADLNAPAMLRDRDRNTPARVKHPDKDVAEMYRYARTRTAISPTRPIRDPDLPLNQKGRHPNQAIAVDEAPSARVQTKMIGELPHELDAQERLGLMKNFCDMLFNKTHLSWEKPGQVFDPLDNNWIERKSPIPYWCVIHAPDEHNDPRNFHYHIAFSERPFALREDPFKGGTKLDFQIVEKTKRTNYRDQWPYAQSRDRDFSSQHLLKRTRKLFEVCANIALEDAGHNKRYDARSFKDMGIDAEPRKNLAKTVVGEEKRGIPNPKADAAVKAQYDRLIAAAIKNDPREPYPRGKDREWDAQVKRYASSASSHTLQSLRLEWRKAVAALRDSQAEAVAGQIVYDKIASRLDPPLAPAGPDAKALLKAVKDNFVSNWRKKTVDHNSRVIVLEGMLERAKTLDPKAHDGTRTIPAIQNAPKEFGTVPGLGSTLNKSGSVIARMSLANQKAHYAYVERMSNAMRQMVDAAAPLPAPDRERMNALYDTVFTAEGGTPPRSRDGALPMPFAAVQPVADQAPVAQNAATNVAVPEIAQPAKVPPDASPPRIDLARSATGQRPSTSSQTGLAQNTLPGSTIVRRRARTGEEIERDARERIALTRPKPIPERAPRIRSGADERARDLAGPAERGARPHNIPVVTVTKATQSAPIPAKAAPVAVQENTHSRQETTLRSNVPSAPERPAAPPTVSKADHADVAPAPHQDTATRSDAPGATQLPTPRVSAQRREKPILVDRSAYNILKAKMDLEIKERAERQKADEAAAEAARLAPVPSEQDLDKKKKGRKSSQEEVRQRAILAAKNRGWSR